jgi:ABC-type phosphate transport system substrate-binding protein
MRNSLKIVLAAVVPALILSACNNQGSATPGTGGALPNMQSVHSRPMDTSANDLHAGGATFPAYAYNLGSQPTGLASGPQALPGAGSLFASAGTAGHIYYCLTGSGFGRGVFTGATPTLAPQTCAALGQTAVGFGARVDPPDFVGSDVGMKSTDYATYRSVREPSSGTNYGEPFQFPAIGGPIIFGYRTEDFAKVAKTRMKLSQWTYCAIANGTVKNWADPAIVADNGGPLNVDNPSEAITFYYRSDSSGTSFLFQNHLATVCGSSWPAPYNAAPYQTASRNAAWTFGTATTWNGPTTAHFIGENGNPGVLAAIQAQAFSTGYVEGAYAKAATEPTISQALLRNKAGNWIDPEVAVGVKNALANAGVTFAVGSDNKKIDHDTAPLCFMYVNPAGFANPTPSNAYPIVGVSYLMFYGNNHGVHIADKLKLINYMVSAAANTVVGGLEYSPLASTIQARVQAAVSGTGAYAGKPCIK